MDLWFAPEPPWGATRERGGNRLGRADEPTEGEPGSVCHRGPRAGLFSFLGACLWAHRPDMSHEACPGNSRVGSRSHACVEYARMPPRFDRFPFSSCVRDCACHHFWTPLA